MPRWQYYVVNLGSFTDLGPEHLQSLAPAEQDDAAPHLRDPEAALELDDGEADAVLRGAVAQAAIEIRPTSATIAAHAILTKDSKTCTGNFFIDDEVLAEAGVTDFGKYSAPDAELALDLFVDEWGPSAPN